MSYLEAEAQAEELRASIAGFLQLPRNEASHDVFDPLYERVLAHFGESGDGEAEHGLGNLTLLDRSTNRSYRNAVFAIKRKSVLELDQAGIFVPICTRNVFLKCYSGEVGHALRWTRSDQEGYLDTIGKVLSAFFDPAAEARP